MKCPDCKEFICECEENSTMSFLNPFKQEKEEKLVDSIPVNPIPYVPKSGLTGKTIPCPRCRERGFLADSHGCLTCCGFGTIVVWEKDLEKFAY